MDVNNKSLLGKYCGVVISVLVAINWIMSLYRRAVTPRGLCWPCFSMPVIAGQSVAHSHHGQS